MSIPTVTVPADLRVEIRDERAADGITPDGMLAYMRAHGWRPALVEDDRQVWERCPAGAHMPYTVMVPVATDYVDYAAQVLRLVESLARIDGPGQLAVWADLRAASQKGDGNEG